MDGEGFVGRADQVALLAARLDAARGGEPSVVLVEGAPGVGKTRLVHHALRDAPRVRMLHAAADAAETDIAWGVVDQLARSLGPAAVEELTAMVPIADSAAVGGWLLGHLGDSDDGEVVAVVVDDLPWADSLSIVALTFALRRLRSDRVLTVFTARSSDLHVLPQGVHQLLRGPQGHVIRLEGFDIDEVEQLGSLLGVELPAPALARLTEQTEGNPLHLTALLDEVPVDSLVGADDRPLPAPASFRSLVLGKLATCTQETERLVVAVATLGLRAPASEAAAVAGLDDVLAPMDEAIERGLLECHESPTGAVLCFVHPMVRAAIYNDLGPGRRAALHRAAADLATDPWTRLRHLVDASTGPDESLAAELEAFAATRRGAGPGGTSDAGAALRLAARVATTKAQREDLLLQALECLLAVGDATGVAELALLAEDFEESTRLKYTRGVLLTINGSSQADLEEGLRQLEQAWTAASEDDDPSMRAGIATQMATTFINQLRLTEIDEWAVRAVEAGAPALLSEPRVASAFGRAASGRYDEALALMPPIPEDGFDLFALARALGGGVAAMWAEDPVTARAQLMDAYDAARAFGVFFVATLTLVYLSDAEHRLGMLDDSAHHAQLAASTAADADQAWFSSLSHSNAAIALALRGDAEAAAEHVVIARDAAFTPAFVLWSEHSAAVAAHLSGDIQGALRAVRVLERDPAYDHGVVPVNPWHVVAADVHLSAGELDDADRLIDRIGDEVRRYHRPVLSVAWWRLQAQRQAAKSDEDGAVQAFEHTMELAPACPSPVEAALAHLEYGAWLRRAGRRKDAAAKLTEAVEVFRRIGAAPHLERAERELAACGLTPTKRSAPSGGLTPQERTVAVLASRGRRNKEIAQELVVSPKTVEYHLGNVYRKLGVSNRAQLVAAIGVD